MARGWGDPVLCSDSGSGRAQALADELGGRAAGNAEVAAEADLVVLCHKPYQLRQVAAGDPRVRSRRSSPCWAVSPATSLQVACTRAHRSSG